MLSTSALGFGTTMLASASLNSLFVTYYLEMFTAVANVSSTWFFAAQIVFMIWNMVNDPLFGWLSDRGSCFSSTAAGGSSSDGGKEGARARRLRAIRGGGWLWALAFMCVWWTPGASRPTATGFYCIAVLCFYDGMLSFVEVNHSALLAEIGASDAQRAEANMYAAVCAAVGSASTFFSHLYWDGRDLRKFRLFCLAVAAVAVLCFEFTARALVGSGNGSGESAVISTSEDETACGSAAVLAVERLSDDVKGQCSSVGGGEVSSAAVLNARVDPGSDVGHLRRRGEPSAPGGVRSRSSSKSNLELVLPTAVSPFTARPLTFVGFLAQMAMSPNFRLFSILNLLQVFDCTFEKNFFGLFLAHYAGKAALSPHAQGLVISIAFVLPWAATVVVTPLVKRIGVYATVERLLRLRVVISLLGLGLALWTGNISWIYLLVNRVTSELVCRLMPLVKCDLVDEDAVTHDRQGSLSAAVVGSAELVGKAGQSLAPMLGFALFTLTPGEGGGAFGSSSSSSRDFGGGSGVAAGSGGAQDSTTTMVLAALIAGIPLAVVCVQRFVWSRYTLHGDHLKSIKSAVASRRALLRASALV